MTFSTLPNMLKAAAFACLALAAWVSWDLSYWWTTKPDYSFGFLVPVFCGYVLYDRWPRIAGIFAGGAVRAADSRSVRWLDWLGFAGIILFFLTFSLGVVYRTFSGVSLPGSFLMTTSFSGLALSTAVLFSDRRADGASLTARERLNFVGLMIFPALVWIISAPLMSAFENAISLFLLNRVTAVVFGVFDMLGFAIERRANVLVLPRGQVGVEEACSGIRSLTGCLFAGSFLAAVFLDRFWKKFALVAAALVLAFLTNLVRSMFLTGWAYAYGARAIEGTVHDVTGYAVLGVTVVLLLCLIPLFNFKLRIVNPPSKAGAAKGAAGKSDGKQE
jgi:exosortase/archaeosortase family protein